MAGPGRHSLSLGPGTSGACGLQDGPPPDLWLSDPSSRHAGLGAWPGGSQGEEGVGGGREEPRWGRQPGVTAPRAWFHDQSLRPLAQLDLTTSYALPLTTTSCGRGSAWGQDPSLPATPRGSLLSWALLGRLAGAPGGSPHRTQKALARGLPLHPTARATTAGGCPPAPRALPALPEAPGFSSAGELGGGCSFFLSFLLFFGLCFPKNGKQAVACRRSI